jgi:uncharacterized protein with HEPN domain
MMEHRLIDQLGYMHQALTDARAYTEGMAKIDFMADRRTQQAVVMNLIILGEAATQVMDGFADFASAQDAIAWRSMRGMRNRIAHGYFDIDMDVVWDTVQTSLTELAQQLPHAQAAALRFQLTQSH